jgi:hypothetical protein
MHRAHTTASPDLTSQPDQTEPARPDTRQPPKGCCLVCLAPSLRQSQTERTKQTNVWLVWVVQSGAERMAKNEEYCGVAPAPRLLQPGRGLASRSERMDQKDLAAILARDLSRLFGQSLAAANDVYGLKPNAQAIFCRRRHQLRRPPLAKIRPGRPAPTIGPGTVGVTCCGDPTEKSSKPKTSTVFELLNAIEL